MVDKLIQQVLHTNVSVLLPTFFISLVYLPYVVLSAKFAYQISHRRVNILSVTDSTDKDDQFFVDDLVDHAVIPESVGPVARRGPDRGLPR